MSTPQPNPIPLINALQGQRNRAHDELADTQASLSDLQERLAALVEANGQLQSSLDDATAQLNTTKSALVQVQDRCASLEAANTTLTKQVADLMTPLAPAATPDAALVPATDEAGVAVSPQPSGAAA